MAEYLIQSESLDAIADAINAKTGGSSAMTPAEMVTAIGSISGGGGGARTYTGSIVLSNQDVDTLEIPVDTSEADFVELNVIVTKTGIVSDGAITYHETPIIPDGFGEICFGYWAAAPVISRNVTMAYGTYVRSFFMPDINARYLSARNGYVPNYYSISVPASDIKRNGIVLGLQNANRKICRAGYHIEFDYIVKVY